MARERKSSRRRRESNEDVAQHYIEDRAVRVLFRDGPTVVASCEGRTRLYALGHDDERGWWCSCRRRSQCPHVLALQWQLGDIEGPAPTVAEDAVGEARARAARDRRGSERALDLEHDLELERARSAKLEAELEAQIERVERLERQVEAASELSAMIDLGPLEPALVQERARTGRLRKELGDLAVHARELEVEVARLRARLRARRERPVEAALPVQRLAQARTPVPHPRPVTTMAWLDRAVPTVKRPASEA